MQHRHSRLHSNGGMGPRDWYVSQIRRYQEPVSPWIDPAHRGWNAELDQAIGALARITLSHCRGLRSGGQKGMKDLVIAWSKAKRVVVQWFICFDTDT